MMQKTTRVRGVVTWVVSRFFGQLFFAFDGDGSVRLSILSLVDTTFARI